jgi:hypothetical protein
MIALAYTALGVWPAAQIPGRTFTWVYARNRDGHDEQITITVTHDAIRETWTSDGETISDEPAALGERSLGVYLATRYSELVADGWRITRTSARYAASSPADGGWLSGSCST